MTGLVAVGFAAASAALLVAPVGRTAPSQRRASRAPMGRAAVVPLGGVAMVLLVTAQGRVLALGLIIVVASGAALRLVGAARARRVAARRETKVVEVCELLVDELRAGQPPLTAIRHGSELWPELEPVVTAARLGADVPVALRRLSEVPGADGLRAVAGAWVVAQGSGAGLAVALGQVAASARAAQSTRLLVASELASATATARLVAALPLLTLVIGAGIGADPWVFLFGTPAGLICLAAGLVLAFLGLAWIDRMAVAVGRS